MDEAIKLLPDVRNHTISAVNKMGLEELVEYMEPGTTIALMGSSGVGNGVSQ